MTLAMEAYNRSIVGRSPGTTRSALPECSLYSVLVRGADVFEKRIQ
jgi:hypothetical protein